MKKLKLPQLNLFKAILNQRNIYIVLFIVGLTIAAYVGYFLNQHFYCGIHKNRFKNPNPSFVPRLVALITPSSFPDSGDIFRNIFLINN